MKPKKTTQPSQSKNASGKEALPFLKRGPRKKSPKGPRPPRHTTHKKRSVWFQARDSWPAREAPVRVLVKERARTRKALPAAPGTAKWESIGPSNIGGRVTSVVCDPNNPDHVWVGAAGGGVWRSKNGGTSWRAQWRRQDVLNVGALAIDPQNPKVLYCGTGEANLSADSYPGVGIYKSTNSGSTWRLVAAAAKAQIPRRIGTIAIDPFDSNHLMIGGVRHSSGEVSGLFSSTDAGVTWVRVTAISTANLFCHTVLFHPTRQGIVFASFTRNGVKGGLWRSADGGQTWTQLTNGLPSPAMMGRTSLAISASNPDVMYALASDDEDAVLGVFRSANGGNTWADVSGNHFVDEGQMFYGNTIAVHPTNPDQVICGGVDLHLTADRGAHWTQVTHWDADRGDADYAHADHHALLIPASRPGLIYDGNDGGLDVSLDGGHNWTNRSNGLAVTMYYDLDVAQSDGKVFAGGAQDNGTLITVTGKSNDHFELLGGDGGWIVFDPNEPRHIYASYQNIGLYRWRPNTPPAPARPPVTAAEANKTWMAFTMFDPNNSNIVFLGSDRVWRTKNDAASWKAVSSALDGSPISAIEIAPANSRKIYIGTENGGIFRSVDGGDNWSGNLAGALLPGHTVTRIETSPVNADLLFVTVGNFGHSHLFRSDDGGLNWADADNGQLPDVPHHALVISPDNPQTIYVCNDVGVFVSNDLGATWMNLSRNLPHVMVVDLVYHAADKALNAATYGRSLWRLKL